MIVTAIVSPSARPRPSIAPLITEDLPNGRTVIRIISQRVAPSACAPSCSLRGVCAKASRATAETIGRIITARTSPATSIVRPVAEAGPFEDRDPAELLFQPLHHRHRGGAEDEDPPEAVDDARDRRQQVDQVAERLRQPRRRDVGDEERRGDRQRDGDERRDRRGQDGAEGERRDVVEEGLAFRQFGGGGGEGRVALGDEEDRDPGQQGQDRHRGDDRGAGEDAVAAAAAPSGRRRQQLACVGRGVDLRPRALLAGFDRFDRRASLSSSAPGRAEPSRPVRRPVPALRG